MGDSTRVRYDDQIFVLQRHGGISRYFVELIRQFADRPTLGIDPELDWRWTRNAHAIEAGIGRSLGFGGRSGAFLRWANRRTRRGGHRARLTHPTFYRAAELPAESEPPIVVTVYDMTPELFPEMFPDGNPHMSKRDYVSRASMVLCISDSTRQDLGRVYGRIEAPTRTTHLGVGQEFRPGRVRPGWCPDTYIVFLGRRDGYKDFPVALEAYADLAPDHPDVLLLAVGGGPFSEQEDRLIARWGLERRVIQRAAHDSELPGVFGEAKAFVFPSRYEGFGLPTLEAMACATPTILANSSSHPEAGGEAALYFPPGDSSALSSQVRRVLSDPDLRQRMADSGLARAQHFTWQRTAAATAEAYRAVAGGESPPLS